MRLSLVTDGKAKSKTFIPAIANSPGTHEKALLQKQFREEGRE